jgi:O-antigen/teichoic acid export membrane protein
VLYGAARFLKQGEARMLEKLSRFAMNFTRYLLATVGPVSAACAQFVLSLVLLRFLDPSAFGSFSFLLTASQFSAGIWSALFCAPFPILIADDDPSSRQQLLRCLFSSNLVAVAVAFALFVALALALGVSATSAILFAAYAAVALLRWFARAHAYATTGKPVRTMMSDVVYSATLLIGLALAAVSDEATLDFAFVTLLVSSTLGMLPFGRAYLASQFIQVSVGDMGRYARVWRDHSRWAFLGVLTGEATANSHAYIVTFFYGPATFAPIAASALLIRPINVAMNALTEFERAQMARQIGDKRTDLAIASLRFFRFVLIGGWIATGIGIAVLLHYAPGVVFPDHYSFPLLATGAALWMAVAATRLLRTPDSALLQAAGAFRPLAFASVASSGISIVAVSGLVATSGALWSIAGILIGEIVLAFWIWRQARRWQDGRHSAAVHSFTAELTPKVGVE